MLTWVSLTSVLVKMGMGPVMARAIAGVNGTTYFLVSFKD